MKQMTSLLAIAFISVIAAWAAPANEQAGDPSANSAKPKSTSSAQSRKVPPVVRSQVGDSSAGTPAGIRMVNIGKKQQFAPGQKSSYDTDINSPKSVKLSADGRKFYVNSLEGCKTVVYDAATLQKLSVIEHKFPSGTGDLWAKASGYYPFTHYKDGEARSFQGKPVESTQPQWPLSLGALLPPHIRHQCAGPVGCRRHRHQDRQDNPYVRDRSTAQDGSHITRQQTVGHNPLGQQHRRTARHIV